MSKVWLAVWLVVGCCGAQGVKAAATVPAAAREPLLGMARRAAVVFAGEVVGVDRRDEAGYVEVTFRLEEAVKGCAKSRGGPGTYVLREWAGLWRSGQARYVIGERYLMMLHERGPSGMSSPLDGGAGRMAILPTGAAVIADSSGVAPAEDGSDAADVTGMGVDVRWVAANAVRTTTASTGDGAQAGVTGSDGSLVWSGPVAKLGQGATPSVAAVLTLLKGNAGEAAKAVRVAP